jgi:hypothetical protein
VREFLVTLHLDKFGVDHDEAQFIGGETAEQAGDDAVDAHGLAGSGGTGDQQVGHGGEVGDDGFAVNVLAEGDGNFRFAVLEGVVFQQFANGHDNLFLVGEFDAHGVLAGDGSKDVEALGFGGAGEVGFEIDDAVHAQAIAGVNFETGDRGALGDVTCGDFDVEGAEGADDGVLHLAQLEIVIRIALRGRRPGEDVQRRHDVIFKQRGEALRFGKCRALFFLFLTFLPDFGQQGFRFGGFGDRGIDDFRDRIDWWQIELRFDQVFAFAAVFATAAGFGRRVEGVEGGAFGGFAFEVAVDPVLDEAVAAAFQDVHGHLDGVESGDKNHADEIGEAEQDDGADFAENAEQQHAADDITKSASGSVRGDLGGIPFPQGLQIEQGGGAGDHEGKTHPGAQGDAHFGRDFAHAKPGETDGKHVVGSAEHPKGVTREHGT